MAAFTRVSLETVPDRRARLREAAIALDEGTPQARPSNPMPSGRLQRRMCLVGARSAPRCTRTPPRLRVRSGGMQIGPQPLVTAFARG
jgi:hypothetical protein